MSGKVCGCVVPCLHSPLDDGAWLLAPQEILDGVDYHGLQWRSLRSERVGLAGHHDACGWRRARSQQERGEKHNGSAEKANRNNVCLGRYLPPLLGARLP